METRYPSRYSEPVSDTPEARPGAPRPVAVKPAAASAPSVVRPGKPVSPAAPTPRRPLPSVTDAPSIVPSDAEEVQQLASSSLMPVAEEAKPPPPPAATARRSAADFAPIPPRPPSSAEIVTSAAPLPAASVAAAPPSQVELADEAVEQLAAVVHAVLESSVAPLKAKQKELEARLEALQKARRSSAPPVRSMAPSVDVTGSLGSAAPGPRPSMISTSYGLVSVMPGPPPRPAIEEALERVGPIDVPDFAGKRKFAGGVVIGVLILAVVGAILATVLSYS